MNVDDELRRASAATRSAVDELDVPPRRTTSGAGRGIIVAATVAVAVLVVALFVSGDDDTRVTSQRDASSTTTATTASPQSDPRRPGADNRLFDMGPLSPRGGHSVVWTGEEMIVWGGWSAEHNASRRADGAAYDPNSATWRRIADAPLTGRRGHAAAWTGTEMLIVGGDGGSDSAAYDPVADSWRSISEPPFPLGTAEESAYQSPGEDHVWIDDTLVIWDVEGDRVASYDPAADRWRTLPGTGLDTEGGGVLRIVGGRLVALAADPQGAPERRIMAAVADLDAGSWRRFPNGVYEYDLVVPTPYVHLSIGIGDDLMVWSVSDPVRVLTLDTALGRWSQGTTLGLESCEGAPSPVPFDGGFLASSCGTSVVYDAATGSGSPVDLGDFEALGTDAVWTGTEVLSWGNTCCDGSGSSTFTNAAWR